MLNWNENDCYTTYQNAEKDMEKIMGEQEMRQWNYELAQHQGKETIILYSNSMKTPTHI